MSGSVVGPVVLPSRPRLCWGATTPGRRHGRGSPTGSGPRVEVGPPDLLCLNIPWEECDIEGELDVKLRFRRKCK